MPAKYKQYNIIEPWLQILCRENLRLSRSKNGKYNPVIIDQILKALKKCFMKDELFALLFEEYYKGGSYYDKLKIKKPDEFDINVLFCIPDYMQPQVRNVASAGYVKLFINNMEVISKIQRKWTFEKLSDANNNLCIDKTKAWFQSLVATALEGKTNSIFKYIKIVSSSGPAITLNYTKRTKRNNVISFDIDLSPCFAFNERITLGTRTFKSKQFFIVPKPLDKNNPIKNHWRLSYPEQEREMIFEDKQSCIRTAIRLLKLYCIDEQNIKSYYIKTLALLLISKDTAFFHRKSLSYSFIQLLLELKESIQQEIPFLWSKDLNLLDCSSIYLNNLNNHIDKFINLVLSINKNNRNLFEKQFMSYFGIA